MSSGEKFERDFEAFLKEDSELTALYRKLPRPEPDAKLDAAVLSMAHRALNPQLVATPPATQITAARRRARWLPVLSAAATAVFAIGVAFKMGPQMWSAHQAEAPAAATTARDDGVVHVRTIDAPIASPPPASPPPPPAPVVANGLAAPSRKETARTAPEPVFVPPPAFVPQKPAPTVAPGVSTEAVELRKDGFKKAENIAPSAAAPQAFPAQGAHTEMDAVERKQAIAEGAWQRLHDNETSTAGRAAAGAISNSATAVQQKPAVPPASMAAPVASAQAPAAAAETRSQTQAQPAAPLEQEKSQAQAPDAVTVSGSNVQRAAADATNAPPADKGAAPAPSGAGARYGAKRESTRSYSAEVLRNSRLYPESWVAAIQRLIHAGRRDDARQNLDLFREKYPQYRLPADIERFALEAR